MPVSTLKDVNKEDEDDKDRQAFYVGGQGQNGGGRFAPTCSAMPSAQVLAASRGPPASSCHLPGMCRRRALRLPEI